jgi:hypothetical protein
MSTEERLPGGFVAEVVRLAKLIRAVHDACAGPPLRGATVGGPGCRTRRDMHGERDT